MLPLRPLCLAPSAAALPSSLGRDHIPSVTVCQQQRGPSMVFHGRDSGQEPGKAAVLPGLGAEPLLQLCVPLCCALQSALPWGSARALSCPCALGWDSPSQACLCPGVSLTWSWGRQRCQGTGDGTGQSLEKSWAASCNPWCPRLHCHHIPALCCPLPARRAVLPLGQGCHTGTRLGTALSCSPQTPAAQEERFPPLLIELHCHRKPRSRSSLEPLVSH